METSVAGYQQYNYKRWSPELIAQFPLPAEYAWHGGSQQHWPHLRRNKAVAYVFETNTFGGGIVNSFVNNGFSLRQTYEVSTPEEAIALIYNLVLFGEQT